MYTSYIGKKFISLFNEKNGETYSAADFFTTIFFPVFFTDENHLMHVGNSPFFQTPKPADVSKHGSRTLAQLNNLVSKISSDAPNMSICVGAPALDLTSTTSGQVSDISLNLNNEDMYASWVGEALAIGVSGGMCMLIDEPEILWALFEGWTKYRSYIAQTPNLKDKQIETWNGQWIGTYFDSAFDPNYPFVNLDFQPGLVLGNLAIPTKQWASIMLILSKKFPRKTITAYCYNLSQTNTTLGFINLYLPEIRQMYQLRDKLILQKEDTILSDKEIESMTTFFNFKGACSMGSIGLKSLEPEKLREFAPKGSMEFAQGKDFKFTGEASHLIYSQLKIWIIAMLNKLELLDLASSMATALIASEGKGERGKTTLANIAKETREAKNVRGFIESVTELLEQQPNEAETFKKVVREVLAMPTDNFPLFATLIRFEYSYQKNTSK